MSMAIKRASYTGDPGFFDFIKSAASVATSFIPVVGTTISQAIDRRGSRFGANRPVVPGCGRVREGNEVRSPDGPMRPRPVNQGRANHVSSALPG